MVAQGHRRQILVFLVAILLPCVVLVGLGVRMLRQDRELAEKRLVDQHRALTVQLRRELAARLDRLALEEAARLRGDSTAAAAWGSGAVVLAAPVVEGRLVLPWERDPRPARFGRLLARRPFADEVASGERAELRAGRPREAASFYAKAVAAATDSSQVVYARLLHARAALAAGRPGQAARDYEAVLENGRDVLDEHGVPLALYAATRTLASGDNAASVSAAIRDCVGGTLWPAPTALYLARDLLDSASASAELPALREAVAARLAASEQAMALQRDLPRLGSAPAPASSGTGETPWVPYGSPVWLVGQVVLSGWQEPLVIVVIADTVLAAVQRTVADEGEPGPVLAVSSGADSGEPLGTAFPGLVARFPPAPDAGAPWDVRHWFYLVALLFVLGVTLFGAVIVSLDVRRELRLAETRSRFVSAVSHELKTPLTAIRMFAETLQLGGASDPETLNAYLETIVRESERLTRLLNNVLDFTKIERGRKQYHRAPADLAEIVNASARAMQYPLEQQRFTLDVQAEEDLPPARVDADAVEQAVLNLLSNAMKYSGESRAIDLRLTRADGDAVIAVSDRGVGIEPDEQRKIFQQFYRVPSKDNEGVPGTGLGLTLVQHVAEGHGGRVTVESAPGHGSTFAIHLPLERSAP